jgi:hypothetical protein
MKGTSTLVLRIDPESIRVLRGRIGYNTVLVRVRRRQKILRLIPTRCEKEDVPFLECSRCSKRKKGCRKVYETYTIGYGHEEEEPEELIEDVGDILKGLFSEPTHALAQWTGECYLVSWEGK